MAKLHSSYSVNDLRICQIVFFESGFSISSLACDARGSQLLRMPARIRCTGLFPFMHSNSWITMASHCFHFYFPNNNSIKHLFMCLLPPVYHLWRAFAQIICLSLIGLFSYLLNSVSSLHILNITPSDNVTCKYVFPSLALSLLSLDSVFGENF